MNYHKMYQHQNKFNKFLLLKQFVSSSKNPQFFLHFSTINKVGINPKSPYKTPFGVCFYPFIEEIYNQLITNKLPFASDMPYLHVISTSSPLTIMNDYSDNQLSIDEEIIKNIIFKRIDLPTFSDALKLDTVNNIITKAKEEANSQTPIGKLWNITRVASDANPKKWNSLFRQLGYQGFTDLGSGIIHDNEPIQSIIFDPSIIIQVKTMINPAAKNFNDHTDTIDKTIVQDVLNKDVSNVSTNKYNDLILRSKLEKLGITSLFDYQNIENNFSGREIYYMTKYYSLMKDFTKEANTEDMKLIKSLLTIMYPEWVHAGDPPSAFLTIFKNYNTVPSFIPKNIFFESLYDLFDELSTNQKEEFIEEIFYAGKEDLAYLLEKKYNVRALNP